MEIEAFALSVLCFTKCKKTKTNKQTNNNNNNKQKENFKSNLVPIIVLVRLHYDLMKYDLIDFMESILMFQDTETMAMLCSLTNPVWVELFSYVNALLCSNKVA